jgi:hypothetical protein
VDDPKTHLTYQNGRVVALSQQGKWTRKICGLNRDDLVRSRKQWLALIRPIAIEYINATTRMDAARQRRHANTLREFVQSFAPFAGMVRTELAQMGLDWTTL